MSDTTMESKTISRDELYRLVWTEPMTKVAPRFGLSDVGMAKLCKRYDIPRPPAGYWAQNQAGKAPEQIPLPPLKDESLQVIEFAPRTVESPPPVRTPPDRVTDPHLKNLIAFELDPDHKILVSDSLNKPHSFVASTKAAMIDTTAHRQNLHTPRWTHDGPRLDISVSKEAIPRALRLMDALIKAFEQRGHKLAFNKNEHHKEVRFVILSEQLKLRLREKTKMVRTTPTEQKQDWYSRRVNYVPTGEFELQLHRKDWGLPERTWKDLKRAKVEEQLNDVMIEMIVAVEVERNWRRQREEDERQEREEQARRWQREKEKRQEQQKVAELEQLVGNWKRAAEIRDFITQVKTSFTARDTSIEPGSELDQWMQWALKFAASIDPLGRRAIENTAETNVTDERFSDSMWPNKPR